MKSPNTNLLYPPLLAKIFPDPLSHFSSSLVGKGHCCDFRRHYLPVFQQIKEVGKQCLRLSGPWPGNNSGISGNYTDCFLLLLVEYLSLILQDCTDRFCIYAGNSTLYRLGMRFSHCLLSQIHVSYLSPSRKIPPALLHPFISIIYINLECLKKAQLPFCTVNFSRRKKLNNTVFSIKSRNSFYTAFSQPPYALCNQMS